MYVTFVRHFSVIFSPPRLLGEHPPPLSTPTLITSIKVMSQSEGDAGRGGGEKRGVDSFVYHFPEAFSATFATQEGVGESLHTGVNQY